MEAGRGRWPPLSQQVRAGRCPPGPAAGPPAASNPATISGARQGSRRAARRQGPMAAKGGARWAPLSPVRPPAVCAPGARPGPPSPLPPFVSWRRVARPPAARAVAASPAGRRSGGLAWVPASLCAWWSGGGSPPVFLWVCPRRPCRVPSAAVCPRLPPWAGLRRGAGGPAPGRVLRGCPWRGRSCCCAAPGPAPTTQGADPPMQRLARPVTGHPGPQQATKCRVGGSILQKSGPLRPRSARSWPPGCRLQSQKCQIGRLIKPADQGRKAAHPGPPPLS